jgi:hypothetical protein
MGFNAKGQDTCPRCGSPIYAFSKKRAAADGIEYCIKCAEEVDREYLEAYTCSMCKRLIGKSEIKFVLPSSAFGGTELPLHKRLLCTSCYNKYNKKPVAKLLASHINKVVTLARAHHQVRPMAAKR